MIATWTWAGPTSRLCRWVEEQSSLPGPWLVMGPPGMVRSAQRMAQRSASSRLVVGVSVRSHPGSSLGVRAHDGALPFATGSFAAVLGVSEPLVPWSEWTRVTVDGGWVVALGRKTAPPAAEALEAGLRDPTAITGLRLQGTAGRVAAWLVRDRFAQVD